MNENEPLLCRLAIEPPGLADVMMFMPGGTHTITAERGGRPATVTVQVDRAAAVELERQFGAVKARSAHKPYFDLDHNDAEASAWPLGFEWRDAPAPGVYARVEWSAAGRDAIQGKKYRAFSPVFHVDRSTPARVIARDNAGLNMGGLVNDPAFKAILPLWAKQATTPASENPTPINTMNEQELAALKAKLQTLETDIAGLKAKEASSENTAAIQAKQTEAALAQAKIATAEKDAKIVSLEAALQARNEQQADDAVKAAVARGALPIKDEALQAKWKRLITADPANECLLAALPGASALSGRVTAGARVQVGNEAMATLVKAYHAEPDPHLRGALWAKDMRGRLANEWTDMVRASNTLGTITGDLVVQRALDLLKHEFPVLSRITADFSAAGASFNQQVVTRTRTPAAVGDYHTSTGYTSGSHVTTDVPITINQHKHVSVSFHANELASTRRALFPEAEEGMHYSLGEALVDALYALITTGNFTNETVSALIDFDREVVVDVKTALMGRKVNGGTRTLLLNSSFHGQLEKDASLYSVNINPNAQGVISQSLLPAIAKFQPLEAANLPTTSNLVGFGFRADALAMATRLPNDYAQALPGVPATAVTSVVTNPDTGVSVMLVQFVDHQLGLATARVALMFGVAKAQVACGQRLVSAATS